MRRTVLGLLAVVLVIVSARAEDKPPSFGIPKMSKPPVIDGTIDPVEWQEAVAVSGVGTPLIARPTTYYLAWDEGHLYFACRAWVRPGYKPQIRGRSPGTGQTFDDGLELHFQPRGGNVPAGRTDSSYKFNINCLGFDGDLQRNSVGQQFRNWAAHFKTATRMTPSGSAPLGGHWWEIEVSSTPEDFELAGPHRAGDVWKLMLGFNHMYTGWSQVRIPAYSSYFDPSGYPVGTLVDQAPGIQMTMDDVPGLAGGQATIKVAAFNPTAQPVNFTAKVRITNGDGAELIAKNENLSVASHESRALVINEKLSQVVTNKSGRIEVSVSQGDRVLYAYQNTFETAFPPEAIAPAQKPKEAFPLTVTFNPVQSTLMLVGDSYYLDNPDAAGALQYRITRQGESKAVTEGSITNSFTHFYRQLIQLPQLADGDYSVQATLVGRDGKPIGTETVKFNKKDEAKAYPEWWNTKLGDTERVIAPFTAMTREKNDVTAWGRRYSLNVLGLPTKIVSQGQPVVAAPSRLVAVVNGREEVIPLDGALKVTETKDWRVSFTGQAKGAGLIFTTKGTVEQDGLVWLELSYAPAGSQPVKLDALRIEFPVASNVADCLYCQGPGANYSARTAMLLPTDKPGKLWDTLDTGRGGSGMVVGSFYPSVWLGNEQRGLLWWGDNDKGWVPADAVPAHAVHRVGDQVILRNNIVAVPITLDRARTVAFGYMASPFRPLVKGWRASIESEDGTFSGGPDIEGIGYKKRRDPKTGEIYDGWKYITPPSANPEEWSAIWAQYKVHADKRVHELQPFNPLEAHRKMFVHTSLPLMSYGFKSPDTRVTDYFASEWEGESWTKTEQDYVLYLADRAFREGGLRAIYWDILYVTSFSTVQNGIAYELPDGRVQHGYNGVNVRRFMMRLVALMNDRGLQPGGLMAHSTNCYLPLAMPWMDAILDGEFHELTDTSTMDWVDGYPIERMRAMSVSESWGTQVSWMYLNQLTDAAKKAKVARGFADWPRMFDTWGSWFNGLPESVLDFGMNDERVVYHPFWRNPFVKTNDKDVLVSLWQLPDRVIIEVFNYNGKEPKNAEIVIDLDKLNLVPKLPWQEFIGVRDLVKDEKEPKTTLDFYARTLKVPTLAPHTGRVIGVRLY